MESWHLKGNPRCIFKSQSSAGPQFRETIANANAYPKTQAKTKFGQNIWYALRQLPRNPNSNILTRTLTVYITSSRTSQRRVHFFFSPSRELTDS